MFVRYVCCKHHIALKTYLIVLFNVVVHMFLSKNARSLKVCVHFRITGNVQITVQSSQNVFFYSDLRFGIAIILLSGKALKNDSVEQCEN